MKQALVTVGLGFGDEGKGGVVEFLCLKLSVDLVVRYSGGPQCGHNVQTLDGKRHTFSQFGAGTLRNIPTFLGPQVIIDPDAMLNEAAHLIGEMGIPKPFSLLTIHSRCLVTTVFQQRLNRIKEISRGKNRHGSCGFGVGETRSYWLKHGNDAIYAKDLMDADILRYKLELLKQRTLLDADGLLQEPIEELDIASVDCARYANFLRNIGWCLNITSEIPDYRVAIFEGAQGVLLDEWYGFHPHTTWSTVTPHHAIELAHLSNAEEICEIGITRSYTTRHGAGPLPTESLELTNVFPDPGNPVNAWQQSFRCGWLDLELLRYAVEACRNLDGLAVTCLDQMHDDEISEFKVSDGHRIMGVVAADLKAVHFPNLKRQQEIGERLKIAEPILDTIYDEQELFELLEQIAPVKIKSYGPTSADKELGKLVWRKLERI